MTMMSRAPKKFLDFCTSAPIKVGGTPFFFFLNGKVGGTPDSSLCLIYFCNCHMLSVVCLTKASVFFGYRNTRFLFDFELDWHV